VQPPQILANLRLSPGGLLSLTTQATQVIVPGMTYSYAAGGGENVDVSLDATPSSTAGTSPSALLWLAHTKPDTTIEMSWLGGLLSTSNGCHVRGWYLSLVAGSHTFWVAYTLSGAVGPAFVFDPTVQVNGYPRASFAFRVEVRVPGA
jgi:hypothetical protein